jgi:hypothetical protein
VHQHDGDARGRGHLGHALVRPPPGHVVDEGGTGVERPFRNLGSHRVDRHRDALVDQAGDHRDDAAQLLLGVDAQRTGSRRLAADVDDVGTLGDELEPVLDGGVGVQPLAAVGEGVGGDIHHPHHAAATRSEKTCRHA